MIFLTSLCQSCLLVTIFTNWFFQLSETNSRTDCRIQELWLKLPMFYLLSYFGWQSWFNFSKISLYAIPIGWSPIWDIDELKTIKCLQVSFLNWVPLPTYIYIFELHTCRPDAIIHNVICVSIGRGTDMSIDKSFSILS